MFAPSGLELKLLLLSIFFVLFFGVELLGRLLQSLRFSVSAHRFQGLSHLVVSHFRQILVTSGLTGLRFQLAPDQRFWGATICGARWF